MLRTGVFGNAVLSAAGAGLFLFGNVAAEPARPSTWSVSAAVMYSPIKYDYRPWQGGALCSVHHFIDRRLQVIAETAFIQYGEPGVHSQFFTDGSLEIIPVSVGLGVVFPTGKDTARPYVRICPTMFHSRWSTTGGFPDQRPTTHLHSGWTPGVHFSAGFEIPVTQRIGVDVGVRITSTWSEGEFDDFHQPFGLGGLNIQL